MVETSLFWLVIVVWLVVKIATCWKRTYRNVELKAWYLNMLLEKQGEVYEV